jgi:hypothetical protein
MSIAATSYPKRPETAGTPVDAPPVSYLCRRGLGLTEAVHAAVRNELERLGETIAIAHAPPPSEGARVRARHGVLARFSQRVPKEKSPAGKRGAVEGNQRSNHRSTRCSRGRDHRCGPSAAGSDRLASRPASGFLAQGNLRQGPLGRNFRLSGEAQELNFVRRAAVEQNPPD